jgi:hypothetical protein
MFLDDKFHGLGLLNTIDSGLFQGNFENHQRVGLQIISFGNGIEAKAEYENDISEGFFVLNYGESTELSTYSQD